MEKKKRIMLIMIMSALLFPSISSGQCETNDFLDKCASGLGTYNYIKSFTLNVKQRKNSNTEYSYVFSKGSTYMLIVCNDNVVGGNMAMNLYDRNHKLIASTYDEKNNKYYSNLVYPCSATGVYYFKATFQDAKKGCGVFIIGFSKD